MTTMNDYKNLFLLRQFEVVAYGCNRDANRSIAKLLRDHSKTYQLIEYFLDEPIRKGASEREILSRNIFFPFLRRYLYEHPFFLDPRGERVPCRAKSPFGTLKPRDSVLLERLSRLGYWMPFERKKSFFGWPVFEKWKNNWSDLTGVRNDEELEKLCKFKEIAPKEWIENLREICRPYRGEYVPNDVEPDRDRRRLLSVQLLEYNLIAAPWYGCGELTPVLGFPIASNRLFYGYLVLLRSKNEDSEREAELKKNLRKELWKKAVELYRPVLAILHEGRHETQVKDEIKSSRKCKTSRIMKELRESMFSECEDSEEPLEVAFKRLRDRRLDLKTWDNCPLARVRSEAFDELKRTLLFGEKYYASPEMREIIKQIAESAPRLVQPEDEGKELPAALIYGEPGSGKESVSKMIPLFTHDNKNGRGYFSLKPFTVNVAAVKPDAIVGPLFVGVDVPYTTADDSRLRVPGALVRTRLQDKKEATDIPARVVVLDELNSLPVEYHGILLRVLEQGEVLPLFGSEPKYVKHLVIGIVNEDPKTAIRETEKKMLDDAGELLGHIARHLLRDAVLSGRKLRPDIFHRMTRTLYVKVPNLENRREDIPILFFFFLRNHLRAFQDEAAEKKVEREQKFDIVIEFAAYDFLMRDDHKWRGNLRELQSVAAQTALQVWRKQKGSNVYEISKQYVEETFKFLERQGHGHDVGRSAVSEDP